MHKHLIFFVKLLKIQYLCKAISVAKYSWNKRECLTSCEIAKSQLRIYKARSSSYTWAAYPCCIFRCLAIPTREYGGQPTFFNSKHCKSSKLAVCGNSCKIRHYENSLFFFHRNDDDWGVGYYYAAYLSRNYL